MREVVICGKTYPMASSFLCIANYKNYFGMDSNLGKDIGDVKKGLIDIRKLAKDKNISKEELEAQSIGILSEIIEKGIKIAYCLIKEVNPDFQSFEEWAKTLNGLFDEVTWITEVVGIASNVFRRNI